MTKEEAREIIERLRYWNTSQEGFTPEENAIHDAKREALRVAWRTLGELDKEGGGK